MTDDLFEYLTGFKFPYPEDEKESQLQQSWERIDDGCYQFLRKVGYNSRNISRGVTLTPTVENHSIPEYEAELTVSCAIQNSSDATPYIVADAYVGCDAEIDPNNGPLFSSDWATTYWEYFDILEPSYFVVFSNEFLTIVQSDGGEILLYSYGELTEEDVETIRETLSHPADDFFHSG